MKKFAQFLGNLISLVVGAFAFVGWVLNGVILCLTLIGIPFGLQCFKMARLTIWPFGYDVRHTSIQVGCFSTILNVVWLLPGSFMALGHLLAALLIAVCTLGLGIPFSLQQIKLAKLALAPFGKEIYKIEDLAMPPSLP